MELEDLIELFCYGQNIEIRNGDTDEIYYKGLLDNICCSNELKHRKILVVYSSNDCDHDDYLIIEVF